MREANRITKRRWRSVCFGTADRKFGAANHKKFLRTMIAQSRRNGRRGPKYSTPQP